MVIGNFKDAAFFCCFELRSSLLSNSFLLKKKTCRAPQKIEAFLDVVFLNKLNAKDVSFNYTKFILELADQFNHGSTCTNADVSHPFPFLSALVHVGLLVHHRAGWPDLTNNHSL